MKNVFYFIFSAVLTCNSLSTNAQRPAEPVSISRATLSFRDTVHDFGTVTEGPELEYFFKFKNAGKEPLIITRVQGSGGPCIGDCPKDPVLPGKHGEIKAMMYTQGRVGHFEKSLTVYSNDPGAAYKRLMVKGDIVPAKNNQQSPGR